MARIRSIVLQSEAAECGLACLAMVAGHHGLRIELRDLRRRFTVSLKGATLAQLMRHAAELRLAPRALRCETRELARLALPCVMHWNFDHFVVLESVGRRSITIVDPAAGRRRVEARETDACFTGIVLELSPTASFKPVDVRRRLRLQDLTGSVRGLGRALVKVLALAFALEVVALVIPLVTQLVVDGALVTGDRDLLTLSVVGGGLLCSIDFALRMARGWIALRTQQSLGLQWTANLFTHLLRLPVPFFEKRHLGDITSRFASLTAIRGTLTNGAVAGVVDGLMASVTLALMFVYSVPLTLVALAALGFYVALRLVAYAPFRRASEERIVFGARENSFFLESIRAVVPLKLYGRVAERIGRWQNLMVDVQNREVTTQRMSLWFQSTNVWIAGIESMSLLYLGGEAVLDRRLSLGMLLAFLAYRAQFGERAAKLVDVAVEIRMLELHAERLADIAAETPEPDAPTAVDHASIVPRIEIRNVACRYADGEPWVLEGCSLLIEAGESLAIVGASGSGKTTLLKILLGLVDPNEGEVRIGAAGAALPVRQIGLSAYRSLIGTVMQDDVLMSGSIAENIACFDPLPRIEAIEWAARTAAVHDEVTAMPMGYQTLVGDMGSSMSGGQRQRVLLARALYRRPKIIALDEATSHLDVDNERRVNAAIQALSLTRITIAHRPETIAAADRVVVLEGGRIVRDIRVATRGTGAIGATDAHGTASATGAGHASSTLGASGPSRATDPAGCDRDQS